MSKLSGGASYLTKESVPAKRLSALKKSPMGVAISVFFALLILFMSVQPLLTSASGSSPHKANAGSIGLFCTSDIGLGMDDKSDWVGFLKVYPNPTEKNRVWTLQEAFGSGLGFVNYEGEGGKDKDFIVEKSPANTFKPGNYDAVSEKLEGVREMGSCSVAAGLTYVSNFIMGAANIQSTIVQAFVVFAFDSNIICADPANPSGACLNLLKVIGGTGSGADGGLIGTLTSSIYMPLLVIAITITAFWIGYKGLVQRKLREAMFGAIWVCLSVIFGLVLLLNPALLAKAPMAVSNAVATCVIGSFSGQNCMDGSGGTVPQTTDSFSTSSDQICRSIAPGASLDDQMSMTVNSLSCTIWRAFVLEPYAQGSFGTSFGSLDTIADTPTKKVIQKAGIDPEVFCVNLGSSESVTSLIRKRANFDLTTGKVCNVLAYQMFLKTNASTTGSITPAAGAIDTRWYNVVVTAANDEGLWAQWAPSPTNSMHKIATALMSGATGLIGGAVLVFIAFFALVYYLTAVILMAFAPLFFLMGVHPGRGKKILLGWLEKVISNVLKYLASALFLIVSVSFYAAILGAATNPALTFLFVIIVSGALAMYRKEIINLIGKASMGGEQLSSKFSDTLKDRAEGVGGLVLAGAGSGLGAAIAGGKVSSGIKAGIQRDLQRGGATKAFGKTAGGLIGNATRQFARNTVDNERDVKEQARKALVEKSAAQNELATVSIEQDEAANKLEVFDSQFYNDKNQLDELNTTGTIRAEIEIEAAREMVADNPYFAQAQLIANQISSLEFEKRIALASGDAETSDRVTAEIQQLSGQRENVLSRIDSDELDRNREEYSRRVAEKMYRSGIEYTEEDEGTRVNLTVAANHAQTERDELVRTANTLTERRSELETSAAGLEAKHKVLHKLGEDIQPGDMLTKKKADDMLAQGEKAYDAAAGKAKVERPMAAQNSMDEVYEIERQRNGLGPRTGAPQAPTSGNDDRGPSDDDRGPQDPGPSGPSGGAPTGPSGPSPVSPTRTLPTSPHQPGATERIPTQPEPGSGIPTQPTRSQSAAAASASEAPGRIPESPRSETARTESASPTPQQPDRAPSIPTQPVNSPRIPAQPSQAPQTGYSEPAQPAVREVQTPAPPSTAPRVPAQPVQAPSYPAPSESSPQTPAQPANAPRVPTQPTHSPRVAAHQSSYVEPTPAPVRSASIPAQPAASPRVPAQPTQSPIIQSQPSAPEQPSNSPRIPAQPVQAPNTPIRQRNSSSAEPNNPVRETAATSQPSRTPEAPARAPRIPSQPASNPRVPAQPSSSPSVSVRSTQQNNAPIQNQSTPAAPSREPAVPPRPSREPEAPMVRNRSDRSAPLAREIRLPSSPQISRVTENSEIPTVSINRENASDNEPQSRRSGLPRRRSSRNE